MTRSPSSPAGDGPAAAVAGPVPRIGPASAPCPRCGQLLPQPPHDPVCRRCAGRADLFRSVPAPPVPLTTSERLYLAALLVRQAQEDEAVTADGLLPDPVWQRVLVEALVGRRAPSQPLAVRSVAELPPVPADGLAPMRLPLGTEYALLREYVRRLATAWRESKCPL